MDYKNINFSGSYKYIYLASKPIEVRIHAGVSWLGGLEELHCLCYENQGVVFQTEANGVKVTMVYPNAEK